LVFYPPKPAPARVIALGSISRSLVRKSKQNDLRRFVTGEEGDEPALGLVRPLSLAVRDGELLVCDVGLEAVVRIDPASGTIRPLVRRRQPQPVRPVDIVVDAAGNAFVADASAGVVLRVDSTGSVAGRYRVGESPDDFRPIAVAVSADCVYVVNRAARSIEVFELATGRHIGRLGGDATTDGEVGLLFPVDVSVDAAGRVYVVDMLGGRVQVYGPSGRLAGSIGRPGDRSGQFARPRSVAVGADGIVYVSDAATQVVQMLDGEGEPLMSFGGPGVDAGAMTLPAGLCIDSSLVSHFAPRLPSGFEPRYLILVANQLGPGRIGVYAFGEFVGADASKEP